MGWHTFWECKFEVLYCDQMAVVTDQSTCTTCKLTLLRSDGRWRSEVLAPRTEINVGRGRQTYVADKLIHASVANNYNSDGLGSSHGTTQNKSIYLKILEVQQ
jgi:hypothetical protein